MSAVYELMELINPTGSDSRTREMWGKHTSVLEMYVECAA